MMMRIRTFMMEMGITRKMTTMMRNMEMNKADTSQIDLDREGQVVTDIIGISTMMMKTVHWIMKRVMEMTKKEKMRRLTLLKTYCLEDLLGESSNSLMMMI
jgi:hypothetical protein